MSSELLDKLRMQKKFRNLKAIQKLLENATQLEEYLTGQSQSLSDIDLPSDGFLHVDKDFHYFLETSPSKTPPRSHDKLSSTIEDNFFYQHMFNFALVVILLLQVIVVWAFIWCRLSKYGNTPINQPPPNLEDGIALRDIGQLPEVIPQQDGNRDADGNRCGRFG